ncbi:hypothetical protein PVAP13_1NG484538 [Panicum virgatum]|uniref:Uncharacterized protein n=1 Tax=Panicum virgatum TaxID=38727 RepID=A0A8T0XG47_PANVG|nr:hypothetical protein PVAP13_1NG484538 [Panicum virgatum]
MEMGPLTRLSSTPPTASAPPRPLRRRWPLGPAWDARCLRHRPSPRHRPPRARAPSAAASRSDPAWAARSFRRRPRSAPPRSRSSAATLLHAAGRLGRALLPPPPAPRAPPGPRAPSAAAPAQPYLSRTASAAALLHAAGRLGARSVHRCRPLQPRLARSLHRRRPLGARPRARGILDEGGRSRSEPRKRGSASRMEAAGGSKSGFWSGLAAKMGVWLGSGRSRSWSPAKQGPSVALT